MRLLPVGEKATLVKLGVCILIIAAGIIALLAFAAILSPVPRGTVGEIDGSAIDANSSPGTLPDVVPAGNETQDGNAGQFLDTWEARAPKHIAYAYGSDVSGINVLTAYWTVPDRPEYNEYIKHTVFLWTGVQQGNLGLVQAVLEWDHDDTGKYWTIACWIVNKRDGTYEVSKRFKAYPGDRIRADLRYIIDPANSDRKVWYVAITDQTQHSMTYLVDYGGAVDTNQNLTVFSGVLEGIGLVRYDADLPGDVRFEDIIYKAEGGVDVPINLTGYVHPDMGQVAVEYEDGLSGSPVIIHTHYRKAGSD